MNNRFKSAYIAMLTAVMAMGTAGAKNTSEKTDAAARITIGNIIKLEDKEIADQNLSVTEYHIDEDGDGRTDAIRTFINRDGDTYFPQPMYYPMSILQVTEMYDQKHKMWKIIEINKVGNKLNVAPTYTPQQKTR